jgi:hypothetical protein
MRLTNDGIEQLWSVFAGGYNETFHMPIDSCANVRVSLHCKTILLKPKQMWKTALTAIFLLSSLNSLAQRKQGKEIQ